MPRAYPPKITRAGDPDGPLYGEVVVFTGALSMSRQEAADMAAQVGCKVSSNVNNKTTLLVVGKQNLRRLAGHKKSSKHRKAEELIKASHEIRQDTSITPFFYSNSHYDFQH